MDSLRVNKDVLPVTAPKITLVDDVVTLGRTGLACLLVFKKA
ncbi:hypothetical protein [Ruegeria atlantica]|nr:hypothetical protein [Ruegeria atlantica]